VLVAGGGLISYGADITVLSPRASLNHLVGKREIGSAALSRLKCGELMEPSPASTPFAE
jgi:hypothetical protein